MSYAKYLVVERWLDNRVVIVSITSDLGKIVLEPRKHYTVKRVR